MCNDLCMTENLFTVSMLAKELGVDRSTVHRRIVDGRVHPIAYAGRHALFTLGDVERLRRGEQQLPAERGAK